MDLPEELGEIIYLDNAATVFPKPREVLEGMLDLYRRFGVNPGRSGYDLCLAGGDLVEQTRKEMTAFFGGTAPERLCFAYNASDALNILIQGMVKEGDHVVSTMVEHNSVIRVLNSLQEKGIITVDYARPDGDCRLDPEAVTALFKPETSLVVVNHASNVMGAIQPVAEIGRLCRERDIRFVVDTAQTAGVVPVDATTMHIDALAFTGHKSLMGPTGIGGLYVAEGVTVEHTRYGGTGVESAYFLHLDEYPYRLEVGTPNTIGIFALHLAMKWLAEQTLETIYRHEMALFTRLHAALAEMEGVNLHGPRGVEERLPVLSFTIDGLDTGNLGTLLDVDHGIASRTGLQCAPLIHEHMGTAPTGTCRLSVGPLNTEEHIDAAIRAVAELAADA
jgi:cysteine desulfurase family protein